jgi:hypothetical protein
MSQRMIVVIYVYWRRQPDPRREHEWLYQVWVMTEMRPAGLEEVEAVSILQATRFTAGPERLGKCLREASAETAADYVEGAVWRVWQTSDDLSLVQAINFFAGVSDSLHEVVQSALENLADGVGVPAPVNLVGADVFATLLTKPIAEPISDLEHDLELLGIFVGLVTGLHPLVINCAKYLIHDQLGSALAKGINNVLDSLFTELEETLRLEARDIEAITDTTGISSTAPESAAQDDSLDTNFPQPQRAREGNPAKALQDLVDSAKHRKSVNSRDDIIHRKSTGNHLEDT